MLSSHGAGPGELLEKLLQRTRKRYRLFHLIWNYGNDRNRVSFPGKYYRLENAQAGPSPYHRISIWTGATGPRMMRLIGRLTDGWVNPLKYLHVQRRDKGATTTYRRVGKEER